MVVNLFRPAPFHRAYRLAARANFCFYRRTFQSILVAIAILVSLPAPAADTQTTAASTFFPTVESSGVLPVTLHCGRSPAPLVSFGMPFPKGFVSDSAQVRLQTSAGAEVGYGQTEEFWALPGR